MEHHYEETSSNIEINIESLQDTMCHGPLVDLSEERSAGEKPKHEEGEPFTEEEHVR